MTLQERLEIALKLADKTRSDLQKAAKVSRATTSQWFSGDTHELKSANLYQVADYLGVNPRWLATGKGSMQPAPHQITEDLTDQAILLAQQYDLLSQANKERLRDYIELLKKA